MHDTEHYVLFLGGNPSRLYCGPPDVWGPWDRAIVFPDAEAQKVAAQVLVEWRGAHYWKEPAWHFFPTRYRPPDLSDQEWEAKREKPAWTG